VSTNTRRIATNGRAQSRQDLTYSERPVKILDTAKRVTCSKLSECAKFNGVTTLRMKPPRSMKKSSDLIILSYFRVPPKSCGFVTPTFFKDKIFANLEERIGCLLN
jgi:hypothetical protein